MNKFLAIAILLAATTSPSWGKEVFTGENLNQAFTVHGRLSVYNGSANLRIWIVGSKRMLYIAADSPALDKINRVFGDGQGWFTRDIFGDFTVEPLAPDTKGHMRPVRVIGVKNVVIAREGKVVSKKKAL
jgi:hypothetical protein